MSELYDEIPAEIVDGETGNLEHYLQFIRTENQISSYGASPLEHLDDPTEIRRLLQTPQLTPAVRAQILRGVRGGAFPQTAAAAAGVPAKFWRQWMKAAESGLEPYRTFWVEASAAEAEAELDLTRKVMESKDTADAKWLLERRFAGASLSDEPTKKDTKWRKKVPQEILAEGRGEDEFKFSDLRPKDRARALSGFIRRLRETTKTEDEEQPK